MGLSEIQQFATYSLDQEARGKCPDARNTSMISRYGVGAKQGGFYLGDDIRIITTKDKGTGVLEFNLNEEEFNRRNVANEEVVVISIMTHEILIGVSIRFIDLKSVVVRLMANFLGFPIIRE